MTITNPYDINIRRVKHELTTGFAETPRRYVSAAQLFSNKKVFASTLQRLDKNQVRDTFSFMSGFNQEMKASKMDGHDIRSLARDLDFLAKNILKAVSRTRR